MSCVASVTPLNSGADRPGANSGVGRAKVLVLIDSLGGGGAQRVAAWLCRGLAKDGYAVTLATLHAEVPDFFDPGPEVARVRLGRRASSSVADKASINFGRVRALRTLLRRDRPEVVVAMMTACSVLALIASRGLSTRTIVSERNFPGAKRLSPAWSIPRRFLYRFADAHVAQTREGAQWITRNARARNVHVIPNTVNWPIPVREPVRAPAKWVGLERQYVLAVGTKIEQKGFDILIDAFSRVAGENPEWDLVILGIEEGGEGRDGHGDSLRRRAHERGMSGRLVLPGVAGNVSDWYERAGIFALSSRYEGFPNVLLEAMAAGCACVAFDCDTGPRDVVVHGVNGILLPPADESSLAAAMHQLMSDRALRARLAAKARGVVKTFSEDSIMSKWRTVIASVAAARSVTVPGVEA